MRLVVTGPNFDTGDIKSKTLVVPIGAPGDGAARLEAAGLLVMLEGDTAKLDEPFPQTPFFETIGSYFDYYGDEPVHVSAVQTAADRIPKEVFYIPALIALGIVFLLQWPRRRRDQAARGEVPA